MTAPLTLQLPAAADTPLLRHVNPELRCEA